MVLDPSMFGAQGDASVPLDQFTATYDDAIRNADSQVIDAKKRYLDAQGRLEAIPVKNSTTELITAAQSEMAKAATVVEQASAASSRARELKGAAIERYSQRGNISPELRQRYSAMAAVESANAQKILAENFEFLNAIPEKREQLHAATNSANAAADLARAQADVAAAATPFAKQEAQARADAATQAVSNAKATEASIKAGTAQTTQQTRITTAQADVAPQAAQAAVDQATANVNKTNQEIADLQRQARQAPTDAQAQQAIQTQITQKQTELQGAQLQLQQAQKLMPLAVAGAQQTLEKNTLGTLYGLQDKAKAIADALRSGLITDPAVAQQQLQDYITTTIQGTTPFERQKTALDAETTRRGQDESLAASQASSYASQASTAGSIFNEMNKSIPQGSPLGGQALLGMLDLAASRTRSFAPSNDPNMQSPLLKSMQTPAPAAAPTPASAPAPAVAAAQTEAPGGAGHTITINIGGAGGGSAPTDLTGGYQGAPNPNAFGSGTGPAANTPNFLQNQRMATPDDLAALWTGDQHFDPTQQPNSGRAGVM